MLDATTKNLLKLLRPENPVEVRSAAALVLGEVGARDPEVSRALCEGLADPDKSVRLQVTGTIARLRIESALPRLLERIAGGGEEGEAATQAAARLGSRGTKALHDLMAKVAPGVRRKIAAALAAAGTPSAENMAVDTLLDSDPGVVDAAARTLIAEVPSLSEHHRHTLAKHLLDLLGTGRKSRLAPVSETAILRLLSALGDQGAEAVFWEHTKPTYPAEVRAAALQAVGQWVKSASKDKQKQLFACAADQDFRVAAPALMILKTLPAADKNLADWLALLDAPDVAVRRAAVEKVGDRDSPAVAAALLKQLHHPDKALREAALVCLLRQRHGRKKLIEGLLGAQTSDETWLLARAQAGAAREYTTEQRKRIFARACNYVDAADRRADALLFLLREADSRQLQDMLADRALALRKKKNYAGALPYLRLLARDPACGIPLRFELACCGLKTSDHELTAEARAADHCLEQFGRLLPDHHDELLKFINKAKWLDAADLFYLGFHFAEKDRRDKEFGGQVLRLVIKRWPRAKWAKDAKSKLRREALD